MSFYIGNNRSDRTPGLIRGNVLNGLCEKICIQTKKVFDACLSQTQIDDQVITLSGFNPANPTVPLTFVSGQNSSTSTFTISNVTIERLAERPNFARVTATVSIPIEVVYVDANSIEGTAAGTFTVTQDVVLYVPQPSIVPFTVEAFGGVILTEGTFPADATSPLTVTCCLALVLKIVSEAEILVPSYGYCLIPPCQSFSEDICNGFFDMPLFPTPASTETPTPVNLTDFNPQN